LRGPKSAASHFFFQSSKLHAIEVQQDDGLGALAGKTRRQYRSVHIHFGIFDVRSEDILADQMAQEASSATSLMRE
jgi:hypothetical protein